MAEKNNNNTDKAKAENGILLYQPKGAAGEYAKWALNLYNGCSHGCTYCYNRRGVQSHAFGDKPILAAPLRRQVERELKKECRARGMLGEIVNLPLDVDTILRRKATNDAIVSTIDNDVMCRIGVERLREDGGVFLSFKCDPLETDVHFDTLVAAKELILVHHIPVTILTKSTDWLGDDRWKRFFDFRKEESDACVKDLLTIGFTITGMDEMETNAPSTQLRIDALKTLHDVCHIKTFVSLEPVVDVMKAIDVMEQVKDIADEIRIGMLSPYKKGRYSEGDLFNLLERAYNFQEFRRKKVFIKNSVVRYALFDGDGTASTQGRVWALRQDVAEMVYKRFEEVVKETLNNLW